MYHELTTGDKDRFLLQWVQETKGNAKASMKWAGSFKRMRSQAQETRANVQQGLMTLGAILSLNGYSLADFAGDIPQAVRTCNSFLARCYKRENLDPSDPALC